MKEKRDERVCIFAIRQKTAGSNSHQRFGVGISGRSDRCPNHLDHSGYSIRISLNKADGMLQTASKGTIGSFIATLSLRKMQQMRPSLLFGLGF